MSYWFIKYFFILSSTNNLLNLTTLHLNITHFKSKEKYLNLFLKMLLNINNELIAFIIYQRNYEVDVVFVR